MGIILAAIFCHFSCTSRDKSLYSQPNSELAVCRSEYGAGLFRGVLFETNGAVTVLSPGKLAESHLLVNNGAIVEKGLLRCNKTRSWVLHNIKNNGSDGPHDLFCMEWTPHRGFYFVTYDGDVKRGREEIAAEKIENEVQM